jgi:hypothetical protein
VQSPTWGELKPRRRHSLEEHVGDGADSGCRTTSPTTCAENRGGGVRAATGGARKGGGLTGGGAEARPHRAAVVGSDSDGGGLGQRCGALGHGSFGHRTVETRRANGVVRVSF